MKALIAILAFIGAMTILTLGVCAALYYWGGNDEEEIERGTFDTRHDYES